jgi:hypothetical protein
VELQPVVLVYLAILLSRKSEGAMTGEVLLHVYDVTNSESGRTNSAIRRLNKILRDGMGIGGIFHGAIQVAHHSYANSFFFFFFLVAKKTANLAKDTQLVPLKNSSQRSRV